MRTLLSILLVTVPLARAAQDPAPKTEPVAPPARTDAKFDGLVAEIGECAAIPDGARRLEAYDTLAKRLGVGPKPPAAQGKWTVKATSSPIDDSKSVTLSLEADKESTVRLKGDLLPQLVVRCKQGKIDAYVITGQPAEKEKDAGKATVTLRFDKDAAFDVAMDQSTDGEALFWPDARASLEKMLATERLLFLFSKADGNPALIQFDLRGFAQVHPQLVDACQGGK